METKNVTSSEDLLDPSEIAPCSYCGRICPRSTLRDLGEDGYLCTAKRCQFERSQELEDRDDDIRLSAFEDAVRTELTLGLPHNLDRYFRR